MKITKKVDALVIGGSLVGLNIFKNLLAEGKSVLLLEKSGSLGGSLFSPNVENQMTLDSLVWTTEKHDDLFDYEHIFKETLTLGKKGLMPFVGFGEQKIAALEAVDVFASDDTQISSQLKKDVFSELPENKILLHSQITAMVKKAEEDETYSLFEINGKNYLEADEIYWTAPVQELEDILPKDTMSTFRQKIKKAKHFDALTARFEVSKEELKDFKDNKFIFMGEDQNPWMGCHTGDSYLTFVSYFDAQFSIDHDFIRKHLKTLKKQISKALPDLFDEEAEKGLSREKISLHRAAISNFNPAKKDGRIKELENFHLFASHKEFWPHAFTGRLGQEMAVTKVEHNLNFEA
jgi:predicted NAD/FAD-dependent oxidoreductase